MLYAKRRPGLKGLTKHPVLITLIFVLCLAFSIALGIATARSSYNSGITLHNLDMSRDLASVVQMIDDTNQSLKQDIRYIASQPVLRDYIRDNGTRETHALDLFAGTFLQSRLYFNQLRWIDASGKERLRYDMKDGRIVRVPDDGLKDISDRYYYNSSLLLGEGDLYISLLELDTERADGGSEPEPGILLSTPVYIDRVRKGFILLNYPATPLFNRIRNLSTADALNIELLNSQSYWLIHEDPSMEWGFALSGSDRLLQHNSELWKKIPQSSGEPVYSTDRGRMAQIIRDRDFGDRFWVASVTVSQNLIGALKQKAAIIGFLIGSLFFIILTSMILTLLSFYYRRKIDSQNLAALTTRLEGSNRELRDSLNQVRHAQDEIIRLGKMSSLRSVVAGISHELATPVSNGAMAMEIISEGLLEFRTMHNLNIAWLIDALNISRASFQKAAKLVSNLQKLTLDHRSLERAAFDVVDYLREFIPIVQSSDDNKDINIEFTHPPVITCRGYPFVFMLVIECLIENAILHGDLSVSGGSVLINLDKNDEKIFLKVQDNGKGMSAEVLSHAMEPFFTTKRGAGLQGLGLYYVHTYVHEYLAGTVAVTSSPGKGTSVEIELDRDMKVLTLEKMPLGETASTPAASR